METIIKINEEHSLREFRSTQGKFLLGLSSISLLLVIFISILIFSLTQPNLGMFFYVFISTLLLSLIAITIIFLRVILKNLITTTFIITDQHISRKLSLGFSFSKKWKREEIRSIKYNLNVNRETPQSSLIKGNLSDTTIGDVHLKQRLLISKVNRREEVLFESSNVMYHQRILHALRSHGYKTENLMDQVVDSARKIIRGFMSN